MLRDERKRPSDRVTEKDKGEEADPYLVSVVHSIRDPRIAARASESVGLKASDMKKRSLFRRIEVQKDLP